MALKPSKTKPGKFPNPPKSRPGEALGGQMPPRSDPNQPRNGQERPTIAQEAPKKRPREAKRRPRVPKSRRSDPQERPKGGPDPSKTQPDEPRDEFRAGILWEASFGRLRERFYDVFRLMRLACDMYKPEKNLRKSMGFTYQELRIESSQSRKNLRKGGPGAFKTMPGTPQNPPKSSP